ncbi:MAG: zinc ribbon domain-containing protein [Gammaproteobacteria bacterium]|nr:zinc ribbon domain-containing protein [Gammaproteobacteria bacterium]
MPIYEYICHDCHKPFELMQKMNDQPCSSCPNCNGNKVEKQVSAAGFQLKGTGWYVTDFKDKKNKTTTTDTKSSANNASSSTDGKTS